MKPELKSSHQSIVLHDLLMESVGSEFDPRYVLQVGLQRLLCWCIGIELAELTALPSIPDGLSGRIATTFRSRSLGSLRNLAVDLAQRIIAARRGEADRGPLAAAVLLEWLRDQEAGGSLDELLRRRNEFFHPRGRPTSVVLDETGAILADLHLESLGRVIAGSGDGPVWESDSGRLLLHPYFWIRGDAVQCFSAIARDGTLLHHERPAPTADAFRSLWRSWRRDDRRLACPTAQERSERIAACSLPDEAGPRPAWMDILETPGAPILLVEPPLLGLLCHAAGRFAHQVLYVEAGEGDAHEAMARQLGLAAPPRLRDLVEIGDEELVLVIAAERMPTRHFAKLIYAVADTLEVSPRASSLRLCIGRPRAKLEAEWPVLRDRLPDGVARIFRYPPRCREKTLADLLFTEATPWLRFERLFGKRWRLPLEERLHRKAW